MLQMIKRTIASVAAAKAGKLRLFPDSASGQWYSKDESGTAIPVAGITSFNGRGGAAITPQQSDYDSFFLTPSEGSALYDALGAAAAAQAASQPLDADLTAIAALVTQAYGRNLLTVASAAVLTAALNPATASLQGAMAAADKKRMTRVFDAVADFGFVGDHQVAFDGATTGGTGIITSSAISTTMMLSGQRITLAGAGAGGAVYVGTVQTVGSGTCTATPNTSTTVSSRGIQWGSDNSAAIAAMQNAVNVALTSYAGVKVEFPNTIGVSANYSNRFGCTAPINFNRPVTIEGIGGGYSEDGGDYTRAGGTCLAWWSSSSDAGSAFQGFITVAPTSGAGAFHLDAPRLAHFWIDCRNGDQNQALMGLKQLSNSGYEVEDFFIMDPLAIGAYQNVVSSLVAGDARDNTRGYLSKIRVRCLDSGISNTGGAITLTPTTTSSALTLSTSGQSMTLAAANGLSPSGYGWVMTNLGYPVLFNYTGGGGTTTLTGVTISAADAVNAPATVSGSNVVQANPNNACALMFDGDTTANSCCSSGPNWVISHGANWGPAAVTWRNSDSWELLNPIINGGNATNLGAINRVTKPGMVFCGSNTNAGLAARNSHIWGGSPGAGGVVSLGVNNAGAQLSSPAGPNYWHGQQFGNGEATPVVETGAAYYSLDENGSAAGAKVGTAQTAITLSATVPGSIVPAGFVEIPPQLKAGFSYAWKHWITKTAAGAGTRIWTIKLGATGTSSDATIATLTNPAGTAIADSACFETEITFNTVGASISGQAVQRFTNTLAATGFSAAGAGVGRHLNSALTTTPTNVSGILYLTLWIATGTAGEVLTFLKSRGAVEKASAP